MASNRRERQSEPAKNPPKDEASFKAAVKKIRDLSFSYKERNVGTAKVLDAKTKNLEQDFRELFAGKNENDWSRLFEGLNKNLKEMYKDLDIGHYKNLIIKCVRDIEVLGINAINATLVENAKLRSSTAFALTGLLDSKQIQDLKVGSVVDEKAKFDLSKYDIPIYILTTSKVLGEKIKTKNNLVDQIKEKLDRYHITKSPSDLDSLQTLMMKAKPQLESALNAREWYVLENLEKQITSIKSNPDLYRETFDQTQNAMNEVPSTRGRSQAVFEKEKVERPSMPGMRKGS